MNRLRTEMFALRLQPGREAEYKRRHDDIWPDLTALFLRHGIRHYEIRLHRETGLLFAVRIVDEASDLAAMADDPVMARWRAHMADLLVQDAGGPMREELVPMYRLQPDPA